MQSRLPYIVVRFFFSTSLHSYNEFRTSCYCNNVLGTLVHGYGVVGTLLRGYYNVIRPLSYCYNCVLAYDYIVLFKLVQSYNVFSTPLRGSNIIRTSLYCYSVFGLIQVLYSPAKINLNNLNADLHDDFVDNAYCLCGNVPQDEEHFSVHDTELK